MNSVSGSLGRVSCAWTVGVRTQLKASQVRLWGTVAFSLTGGLAPYTAPSFSSAFQTAGQHKAGRRRVLHPTSKRPALECTLPLLPSTPAEPGCRGCNPF